jgi:hypothetical protein
MALLIDEAQVEARFNLFGDSANLDARLVLILMQDWCMVCAKHTIGLEIVLDAPNGTPR